MERERQDEAGAIVCAAPALVAIAVACLGWGAMRFFWEFAYKNTYEGLRSFPYYLSANWGDPLVLPAISALICCELRRCRKRVRARPVCIAGVIGALGGAASQVHWTHDAATVLNWTFQADGSFNAPGWYHAVFLSAMCGLLLGGVVALILLGRDRPEWSRESVLRYLAVGYLFVLFSCLLATDNKRSAQGMEAASFCSLIETLAVPLTCSIAVVASAVACRGGRRILVRYSAVLLITSICVPLALLMRGLRPVSGSELFCCAAASFFALTLVTAPAASTFIEQLARSLPVAVLTAVLSLAIPGLLDRASWVGISCFASLAVISVAGVALAPCTFDSVKMRESFRTAFGVLCLVVLVALSSAVERLNHFAENTLSLLFPVFIYLMVEWWVKDNFGEVTRLEADMEATDYPQPPSPGDARTVNRDALSKERVLRYKVLAGLIVHAGCVLVFLVWARLAVPSGSSAGSVWRVALCTMLIVVMAEGAFVFSCLSFRDNVFVLRGKNIGREEALRIYSGAGLIAFVSVAYGCSTAVLSSTRASLIVWALMLLVYALAMLLVCSLVLHGVPGLRDKEWPCVSSPWAGVKQDHLVSLLMLNVFGIGFPIWVSDRLVEFWGAVGTLYLILTLLGAVFHFFLTNNVEHVERERRRVGAGIEGDSALDASRGREYLAGLEVHCKSQNRAAAGVAFLALSCFFVMVLAPKFIGFQGDTVEHFRRMFGGEDWWVARRL